MGDGATVIQLVNQHLAESREPNGIASPVPS
jgi:hypothetical protein